MIQYKIVNIFFLCFLSLFSSLSFFIACFQEMANIKAFRFIWSEIIVFYVLCGV